MTTLLVQGDCRSLMSAMPANSADAIVTDPPYHLMKHKKGGMGEASVNLKSPHGRARIGAGFMNLRWDGGDVAFDPATWAEALRILKPGAMVAAFGGTRTYHRLVCAIEDAGFEIRDMLGWLYGSGFPKSTDKAKIPEAWRGWNTALKPAIEPICLARKPMEGTLAENLTAWGTGALWIDGCRIAVDDEEAYQANHSGDRGHAGTREKADTGATDIRTGGGSASELGRWPANIAHDGSWEVLELFPQTKSGAPGIKRGGNTGYAYGAESRPPGTPMTGFGDAGSAARFFYCPKASKKDRDDGLPAGVENHHATVKPTELMRWLCRLVTPPGGTIVEPFLGSGSTLKAAALEGFDGIGFELEHDHIEIARWRVAT